MYYTIDDTARISIIKFNTATGQSKEIFNKDISLVFTNDYIYADNDTVYYAKDGNIYKSGTDGSGVEELIAKDEIFSFGVNQELLNWTLGDGYVDNMLIHDGDIYFCVTDGYSGGIFLTDLNGGDFQSVAENMSVERFEMSTEGNIYAAGYNIEDNNCGLYKTSNGEYELLSDKIAHSFYVNNSC